MAESHETSQTPKMKTHNYINFHLNGNVFLEHVPLIYCVSGNVCVISCVLVSQRAAIRPSCCDVA